MKHATSLPEVTVTAYIFSTEPDDRDVCGYDPDLVEQDDEPDPDWEFDRYVGRGTTDRRQIYRALEIAEGGF